MYEEENMAEIFMDADLFITKYGKVYHHLKDMT